jgi:biopolymer transport protein ExbB/TolQ
MLSAFCIWIVFFKVITLKIEKQAIKKINKKTASSNNIEDFIRAAKKYPCSSAGKIIIYGSLLFEKLNQGNNTISTHISNENSDKLKILLEHEIERRLLEKEDFLSVLGTSAAVSPLIGLFGTI